MKIRPNVVAALLVGTAGIIAPAQVWAQAGQTYQFDLPAQDLGDALQAVAARAGLELYVKSEDLAGKTAPEVRGSLTARAAIEELLAQTDLVARFDKGAVIVQGRSGASAAAAANSATPGDIVVTGTHIAGGESSSPVMTISSEDMKRAGHADLGEVVRSLPQNFGGGQNPGIGTSQGTANGNINGASSVNLLGMGPNATLTLLNGNRISYTGVNAAIDIGAIPALAVDHIDVVTDGGSAIYGADAVAGVVNVVLRRDYNGGSVGARLGGATDGGGFEQQYNAVLGRSWKSGSIVAAYDYLSTRAVFARDRSYAAGMAGDSTLYPSFARHSGIISAQQNLTSNLRFTIDFLYKDAANDAATGFSAQTSSYANGGISRTRAQTLSVAPTLEFDLSKTWSAKLVATYGYDKTRSNGEIYFGGSLYGSSFRLYNNDAESIELNASGTLAELPAGPIRLALGGGYRRTTFKVQSIDLGTTASTTNNARTDSFGFGELYLPLASPAGNHPVVRSLALTAAIRHERNSGVQAVTTPKLGVVYEPVDGLTLRANWGRSFRLPTFYQQYSGYSAILLPVSGYGAQFLQGSTFIELLGANTAMKPERAESWTLSAEFKPHFLPALIGSVTYFHFNYRDRVATPLLSSAGVLTNPLYADLITASPTAQQQASVISGATLGLQNATSAAYDPANVVAVFDDRDRNIARQRYEGVNFSLKYSIDVATDRKIDLFGAVTWLRSRQQIGTGQAYTDLAGTIFNPPHWKSRLGIGYSSPLLSISVYGNIATAVVDNRQQPFVSIGAANTMDLAAQVRLGHGLEVGLIGSNVLNAKPARIMTTSAYDTPFDTTNYNSIGRTFAVSLRKSW